jgi:hypothetical protein
VVEAVADRAKERGSRGNPAPLDNPVRVADSLEASPSPSLKHCKKSSENSRNLQTQSFRKGPTSA